MRLFPLLAIAAVLAAGCTSPDATPTTPSTAGPVDLTGKLGLLAVDLAARRVTALTEKPALAWMSPGGTLILWTEESFSILVDTTTNARQVTPTMYWARIHDNRTGLALTSDHALIRNLSGGEDQWSAPIPPSPAPGVYWNGASEDLSVLAAESAPKSPACANDIYIRAAQSQRTQGCHLRVARDGRVGWTEATGVRVRGTNGTITNVTGTGAGNIEAGEFTAHENPVFADDGVLYLRLVGGKELLRTEVIGADGEPVAKIEGDRRLALLDVSADGNRLLVRAFDR